MNKLILILLLLPFVAYNQQKVNFCGISAKEYTVVYEGDTFDIEIIPETFYQIENNKVFITYEQVGTYLITATAYKDNCYAEDKLVVEVVECDSTLIWIPNAFTPNEDKNNPEFGAYGINVFDFNMEIYNRWGELLFVSNDINNRWDGTSSNGLPCQEDIYTYTISYIDRNKRYHKMFGRITLIY